MMGHVVLHRIVGGVAVVLGKHTLEVGFGHAGKADEVLAGKDEDTLIAEKSFKRFESGIIMTMSGSR